MKCQAHFVLPPVLIICCEVTRHAECTGFTTTLATIFQLTVILSPSLVLHGPWWCPGRTSIVHYPLCGIIPLRVTLQSTRIPITGICTAWVWHEWGRCKVTPLIGEQRVASRLMASISQTTSAGNSRISTSLTLLGPPSARKWSTWTSVGTLAFISLHAFGSKTPRCCTSTAVIPAAILTRGLAQCQVKTTLVFMEQSTPSSAAQREICPPHSGGSEPICKLNWR